MNGNNRKTIKKHFGINKLLIFLGIICILFATLIIGLYLNDAKISFFAKSAERIKESYTSTGENTWNVSATEDDSVTATLSEDGILAISGTGKMKGWSSGSYTDWYEVKEQVKTVVIEYGITNIGNCAFQGCSSLLSIEIPSSVTRIGGNAFLQCSNLINVEIPNSVTYIGTYAFTDCSSLTSIKIPNSLVNIGSNVFDGCSSVTSIEIPSGVITIGNRAFADCSSLTSIEIPSSVTSIGDYVFSGCSSLTNIKVDENNQNYMDDKGVLYTKDNSKIIKYPANRTESKYTILEGATSIQNSAFSDSSRLICIEIPSNVTKIGGSAFNGCSSLKEIGIPSSVISIENYTFSECSSLTSIDIPNNITSIGYNAFYNCSNLTNIYIPTSVTSIGNNAFEGCSNLASIEIPSSVTSIGQRAFSRCVRLKDIIIPKNEMTIGKDVFSSCKIIKIIESVDNNIELIDILKRAQDENDILYSEDGFETENCILDGNTILLDEGVNNAKIEVKTGKLKGLTYYMTFMEWDISENGDKSVIAKLSDDGILTISGDGKMKNWDDLSEVPWNYIGNQIKNIKIASDVTSIGEKNFYRCFNLISIDVDKDNQHYMDDDGVLYEKDGSKITKIIKYPANRIGNEYTILEGVTSVGMGAFYECFELTSVIIPSSVTCIEEYAFYWCSNLKNIELPSSIITIGDYAFEYCWSLTSVEIPNSVTTIGDWAFSHCSDLTKIIIPKSVTTISFWDPFNECSKLNIICKSKTTAETYAKDKDINYTIDDNAPIINVIGNLTTDPLKTAIVQVSVTDEIAGVNESNLKYLWTTESANITKEQINTKFDNEDTLELKDVTGTYYLWMYAKDKLENEIIEKEGPFYMDNIAPTADVSYSETNPTNKDVTVTITANEKIQGVSGWTLSTNGQELTKTYTSNGTENVIIKDIAGNEIETPLTITVNNIDKEKPTASVSYSATAPTNGNVIVTITANKKIQGITGWTLSTEGKELTKEYSSNTEKVGEYIIIKDIAGNEITVNVMILNIDKIIPTLTINSQNKSNTITITAEATDEDSGIDENSYKYYIKEENREYGTPVTSGASYTFENLQGNVNYIIKVEVSDMAGNVTSEEISTTIVNKITSKEYKVDEEKAVIKGIKPKATVGEIKQSLAESEINYEIVDLNGNSANNESQIGTGYKVKMAGGKEYTIIVWGDFTGDGKISVSELAAASRVAIKKQELNEMQKMILDVSMDGKINIPDLAALSRLAIE